jgi:nucleotide-binding universal stress UspA family protein
MPIRTILVAVSGGSATDGAIELACHLASRLRAHVEGYHVLFDPLAVFAASGAGGGVAVSDALIEEMSANAAAGATKAQAAFNAAAQRHGLPYQELPPQAGASEDGSSCCWRQETGHAPKLVARRARFFDLLVLGRSERAVSGASSDTIEQTLEESGRPILLAPSEAPSDIGRSVALAWNDSLEAVRALAVAIPLLAAADSVTVITAGEASDPDVASVINHLAWHGIAAKQHHLALHSRDSIGAALLGAAQSVNADILVMGGYGRRPWREALFGGATREIISTDTSLPLLLVH